MLYLVGSFLLLLLSSLPWGIGEGMVIFNKDRSIWSGLVVFIVAPLAYAVGLVGIRWSSKDVPPETLFAVLTVVAVLWELVAIFAAAVTAGTFIINARSLLYAAVIIIGVFMVFAASQGLATEWKIE